MAKASAEVLPEIDHGHYTRAKDLQYRAAGVLPISLVGGKLMVLLGGENSRSYRQAKLTCRWRDFGGHREAVDDDAESTAAREFSEETLGLFGGSSVDQRSVAASTEAMAQHLRNSSNVFRVSAPMKRGNYRMFVAEVPYIDQLTFSIATQENERGGGVAGAEKISFAWVHAASLVKAVQRGNGSGSGDGGGCGGGGAYVPVLRAKGLGRKGCARTVILHPSFVNTIRRAIAAKLVDFLDSFKEQASTAMTRDPKQAIPDAPASLSPEHMLFWIRYIRSCCRSPSSEGGEDAKAAVSLPPPRPSGPCSSSFPSSSTTVVVSPSRKRRKLVQSEKGVDVEREEGGLGRDIIRDGDGGVGDASTSSGVPTADALHRFAGDRRRQFLGSFPVSQRGGVANAFHSSVRQGADEPKAIVELVLAAALAKSKALTSSGGEDLCRVQDEGGRGEGVMGSMEVVEKRPWESSPAEAAGRRTLAVWVALASTLADAGMKDLAVAYAESVVEWERLGSLERSRLKKWRRFR